MYFCYKFILEILLRKCALTLCVFLKLQTFGNLKWTQRSQWSEQMSSNECYILSVRRVNPFYFILSSEINAYLKQIKMVFSQSKTI